MSGYITLSKYRSGPESNLNFEVCRFPIAKVSHISQVMLQLVSFYLMKYSFWPTLTRRTYGVKNQMYTVH